MRKAGRCGGLSSWAVLSLVVLCSSSVASARRAPGGTGAASEPEAAGMTGVEVPEALRPWVSWVLHGQEQALCPFFQGDGDNRECAWPARLSLALDEHGGRFTQQFRVYKRGQVPLPGNAARWPQEVSVDGKPAVVASASDADEGGDSGASDEKSVPHVLLGPGDHVVSGSFLWDAMPESLRVPPDTGLVALSLRGKVVPLPSRDEKSQLWLQKSATNEEEADLLELTVHRLVSDDIPLQLTTSIELRVAGRSREVLLARALPDGFVPLSLDSPIPARVEADGRLRVQLRAGAHKIVLIARHDGKIDALSRPPVQDGEPWVNGDEVWVWSARPDLRQVSVEGVPSIDPQQTTLPAAWKKLPAYLMKSGDTLRLVEQRRGDSDPAPDELHLSREIWLDFDGGGYLVSDRITGRLNRAWRLEVDAPTELGRVAVGGAGHDADQFITRGAPTIVDGRTEPPRAGVEIRQGAVNLSADSRIPGALRELPAVSWNSDFHTVTGTLHLPPGWRLFAASGADDVPDTWVRHWTLLDLFLVLIVAMAVTRLYGVGSGVLALVTLGLILPEPEAPGWLWLPVIAVEALLRVLPSVRAPRLVAVFRVARAVFIFALTVVAVPFAIHEVRRGMYPALEHEGTQVNGDQELTRTNIDAPVWQKNDANALGILAGTELPGQASAGSTDPEPKGIAIQKGGGGVMDGDSIQGLSDEGGKANRRQGMKKGKGGSWSNYQQYAQQYDPNSMVQTGPGLPRWDWNTVSLRWSGPVERGQRLYLTLIPPWANLLLALLRVALTALLLLVLAELPERLLPFHRRGRPAGALLALVIGLTATTGAMPSARADVPPKEMLDELQKRLLEHPECQPNCASSARLSLEILPRSLRARMEVGVAAATAVPLPGSASQWSPSEVILDGKPAPALLRDESGRLWIALAPGSHQITLEGLLPNRDTVQIPLPLKPHRVEAKTDGWRLEGLHEDGLADDDLQLTRESRNKDEGGALQAGALPPPLPPFVRVERELHLGLHWEADTRVVRVSPTGAAVVLEVPLLPGESVTTPEVRVLGGKALVNMAPSATEVSWHSVVQERPSIKLVAQRAISMTEVWRLDVSPVWHVSLGGLPVVHQHDDDGLRRPEWRPWPGEEASIEASRPEGIAGQTLTIDHTRLDVQPGIRATDVTLTLDLRSSRGGQHVLTLPEGAVLQSVKVNGAVEPIRQDRQKVTLPLVPGHQTATLVWREPAGIGTLFRSPSVHLGAPSVNTELTIAPGADRWTLLAAGPRLGPAVLFWSLLVVLVLVAVALGQVPFTPLRTHDWILLGLGLSQVPSLAAAVVAVWLLGLGYRQRVVRGGEVVAHHWFNLRQVGLAVLTVAALGILVASIRAGLLGQPDMQISGNGSSAHLLRWYQDRSEAVLPRAMVLSVPLLIYRLSMLAWALWLARSLLGWLRWGWTALSDGGIWRAPPRRTPPTTTSSRPAAPDPTANPSTDPPPAPSHAPPPPLLPGE